MDLIGYASLGTSAVWRVIPDDPNVRPLVSLLGFKVVNPLLHPTLFKWSMHTMHSGTPEPKIIGMGDQYALVRSPYLAMLTNHDAIKALAPLNAEDKDLAFFEGLASIAKNLTRALRYVTKQAQLPQEPGCGIMSIHRDYDFTLQFPKMRERGNTFVSNYELETAITLDRILEAERILGYPLPVVDSLLLDSIQALLDSDYRRALLFAAIAMETHVATTLDEFYNRIIESDQPSPNMHVISFELSGGTTQEKDPVYASLAERAKTDFAMLLHELPLYLFSRSVLVENHALYQQARRLYRTRNLIVHRGEISDRAESSFDFSYASAREGIESALAICRWFGLTEQYALPGSGHVELRLPDSA